MRRHHTGSGRRTVIPAGWAEHHAGVAASTHVGATVALRHPGGERGAFNPTTGQWALFPHEPYWTGPARIQVLSDTEQSRDAADQELSTVRYAVLVDRDVAQAEHGDLVTVLASADDSLAGRTLTVESIDRGSLLWERRLVCTDDLTPPADQG